MSVDIEDQVENPVRTKTETVTLREFPVEEPKKGLANPKVRRMLLIDADHFKHSSVGQSNLLE